MMPLTVNQNIALPAVSKSSNSASAIRAVLLRASHQPECLIVLLAAYMALTQNLSFWQHVRASLSALPEAQSWAVLASVVLTHLALSTLLLGLFALGRLFKPVCILVLLVAAACAWFMDEFGTVFDTAMMHNLLQTDRGEASETLGASALLYVFAWGVVPSIWLWRRPVQARRLTRAILMRAALLLGSLIVLLAVLLPQYKQLSFWGREHREVRLFVNPIYPLGSVLDVVSESLFKPAHSASALQPLGVDAQLLADQAQDPLTLVLVLGETARADHFAINGYKRPTTPQLSARDDLFNFVDMQSCGTYTALSLPCMFSRRDRANMDRIAAAYEENLLDVLMHAGVDVRWVENDGGCKGVCNRVPGVVVPSLRDGQACGEHGCRDPVLLDELDQQLDNSSAAAPRFLVLHQHGSHGPGYYRRVDERFRPFQPVCSSDGLSACQPPTIINAYDNTIVQTDWVIAQSIQNLQQRYPDQRLAVMYVSDHGESLGEGGIWLHGLPWALAPKEQTHVPFVLWFSERERARYQPACMQRITQQAVSHDNLFDLALGLYGVQTDTYRREQDPLAVCRREI